MPVRTTPPAVAAVTFDEDAYLTPFQLSRYSGFSVRHLDRFMKRPLNPLPFYRVGAKRLIRRSDFDRWMRDKHDTAQAEQRLNTDIDDLLKGL